MPRPGRLKRSQDRAEIARRALEGQAEAEIAPALGLSRARVSRALGELKEEWLASANLDLGGIHAQDLATLATLKGELGSAWERSREPLVSVRTVVREGTGAYTSTALCTEKLSAGKLDFIKLLLECQALERDIHAREAARVARAERARRHEQRPLASVDLDLLLAEFKRRHLLPAAIGAQDRGRAYV